MTVAKKIISTLLLAAVAVGIGLVLALFLPQGEYPPPDPTPTGYHHPYRPPAGLRKCPTEHHSGILLVSL